MGQRTATETLSAVIVAFWKTRVWSQAELARELGVHVRTVRRVLDDLQLAGWPLTREEDHPHVYWSTQPGWFPGGVMLESRDAAALLRVLARVGPSRERAQLIARLSQGTPAVLARALQRVVPGTSEVEEQALGVLLDALAQERPVRVRYYSASRGTLSHRVLSVQRVMLGPPSRLVAWCHATNQLRWFRVDSITGVQPDVSATFHAVDDSVVEELVQSSIDGFHGKEKVRISFFVHDPDARWVANNLPEGLSGTPEDGGLLVEAETGGLLPVARYVVGLGAAAECRTAELREAVAELARGALRRGTESARERQS
ncbi:MAG: WYL domain-containing protein [Polyangiaceae bacterium]